MGLRSVPLKIAVYFIQKLHEAAQRGCGGQEVRLTDGIRESVRDVTSHTTRPVYSQSYREETCSPPVYL